MAASLRTLINLMQNSLVRNSVGFELRNHHPPNQHPAIELGVGTSSDAGSLCEFWAW